MQLCCATDILGFKNVGSNIHTPLTNLEAMQKAAMHCSSGLIVVFNCSLYIDDYLQICMKDLIKMFCTCIGAFVNDISRLINYVYVLHSHVLISRQEWLSGEERSIFSSLFDVLQLRNIAIDTLYVNAIILIDLPNFNAATASMADGGMA